jgi:hypothetical protein
MDFSLEELRLADYKQGHGPSSAGTRATTSACPLQRLPRPDAKKHNNYLDLYAL